MGLDNGAKGFLLLVLAATLLAVGQARTIIVGGSEGWRFGVNYTDWAIQNAPFYINDKLVFKYDPPSEESSYAYTVYSIPYLGNYVNCDFRRAKLLANETQGVGEGFEVELSQWKAYYFASEGGNGHHCKDGPMKFIAVPAPRPEDFP